MATTKRTPKDIRLRAVAVQILAQIKEALAAGMPADAATVQHILDGYYLANVTDTNIANTIGKNISATKALINTEYKTEEWAWMPTGKDNKGFFKSPRCDADAAVRAVDLRRQLTRRDVLECDLTGVWVSIKDVIKHPENYGWHEWAVAVMFSTGKRWYDLIASREVTVSGRYALDWATLSKDNPAHTGNRTIFRAKKVLAVLRRLQDNIENVQGRTHVAVGNNYAQWFRNQKTMVALRKVKLAFDANFEGVDAKSAVFTPHDMRQVYVAWMKFQDDVKERWFTEEASKLLGHSPLSGNGRCYAFIRHVPAEVDESKESGFGPVVDGDDEKENTVTRAAKKAKLA